MDIDALISLARQKVSGRVPSYINMVEAADASKVEVTDMVMERIQSAMEQAILGAQSILRTTCQKYIEGLYVTEDLKIGIREDVAYLEDGYDRREMQDKMLSGPNAKDLKDGSGRYAIVPIGNAPNSNIAAAIGKKTSELFTKGRQAKASARSLDLMVRDMQSVIRKSANAPHAPRNSHEKEFRTVTDKQDSSKDWVHPGFQGVNQLEFINLQLQVDLEEGALRILETTVDRMRR